MFVMELGKVKVSWNLDSLIQADNFNLVLNYYFITWKSILLFSKTAYDSSKTFWAIYF